MFKSLKLLLELPVDVLEDLFLQRILEAVRVAFPLLLEVGLIGLVNDLL